MPSIYKFKYDINLRKRDEENSDIIFIAYNIEL